MGQLFILDWTTDKLTTEKEQADKIALLGFLHNRAYGVETPEDRLTDLMGK